MNKHANKKIIKTSLVIALVLIFFLSVSSLALAEKQVIKRTSNTETLCEEGSCVQTAYPYVKFVEEDNYWVPIEEARSLMDKKGIKLVIDEDARYPLRISDFNYTSIVACIRSSKEYLHMQVPLRVVGKTDLQDLVYTSDYVLKDRAEEKCIALPFNFGEKVIWGFNSSTVEANYSAATIVDDSSYGSKTWSNPTKAAASDDLVASSNHYGGSAATHYLKATNFSFNIPTDATIEGIEVLVEKHGTPNKISDSRTRIVKDGSIGTTDRSKAGYWPSTDTNSVYGNATDGWGESWTYDDINDELFGLAFSALLNPGIAQWGYAYVDYMAISVYYSQGSSSPANESTGRTAIETGISESSIGGSASIYTDQQLYLTYLNGSQMLGTFDKLAISGDKFWAINYISGSDSYTNMLNMTPTVYVLELFNETSGDITAAVKDLIDGTSS